MPFEFLLMRFPHPTQPGQEALDAGPQPISREQIRQVAGEMPELHPGPDGEGYITEPQGGPHIRIHVDPCEPPEFISVDFDRYAGQDDYATARAVVDKLCEGLRLTIADDPDATALGEEEAEAPAGGLVDRLRGIFRRQSK
ncbi:MAG: hypothetical protein ACR2M0_09090 [Chloroflexia bacterium]